MIVVETVKGVVRHQHDLQGYEGVEAEMIFDDSRPPSVTHYSSTTSNQIPHDRKAILDITKGGNYFLNIAGSVNGISF